MFYQMDKTQTTITSGYALAMSKFQGWYEGFFLILPNLIVGSLLLLIFFAIGVIANKLLRKYFSHTKRVDLGRLLGQSAFWGISFFGFLIALTIITPSLKPVDLLSGLGLGSLAIGFAFKDILQNWLSGLLILLRLPFRRGDQIEVIGVQGTVLRVEPRATILRTFDGKDIVIPNTTIYTNDITILTSQPTRRVEMDITVGYEYDIDLIRTILSEALAKIEEIKMDPPPQILCWELGATSLCLKLRWWIASERSQEVISRARAVEAIKDAFAANDIDPTDPSLVYSIDMSPQAKAKAAATSAKKSKSTKSVKKSEAPDPINMAGDDPETYTRKIDDKADTLLSEDGGVS